MACVYFETVLNDFCLQINNNAKYFSLSCPRHCDRELIVVQVYYFQIWNKKEHIIISRVINHIYQPLRSGWIWHKVNF